MEKVIKDGTRFIIEEYDGAESFRFEEDIDWITA
jgi:hypothetical protein